jgi:hypothetical protein
MQEVALPIATLGIKAAFAHMPAFRRVVTDGRYALQNGFDDELESIVGNAPDILHGSYSTRYDPSVGRTRATEQSGGITQRIESGLDRGVQASMMLSLMAPITAALQRWAMKALAQKFTNMAYNLDTFNKRRLSSLGISDDMLDRISAQIRQYSDTQDGLLFKKKIRMANLNSWTDLEARAAFEGALLRGTRRMIQENDIGMMHRYFSNPLTQTIFQFRTFMLGSFQKQLLHNIHMRDPHTFAFFTMASVMAGLGYVVQEHLRAVGDEDAQSKLQERLKPQNIALASFQRSAYGSIMPMFADTFTYATDGEPLFDFRSTAQPSNIFLGNPTTSLLFDRGPSALGTLLDVPAQGRGPTQSDIESVRTILPFGNAFPMAWTFNLMKNDRPRFAPSYERNLFVPDDD